MRNVLLVGGTGFLASYLIPYLANSCTVDFTSRSLTDRYNYTIPEVQFDEIDFDQNYTHVIDNINPMNLSLDEIRGHQDGLHKLCIKHNAKLIQISSISALHENRDINDYNAKKAYAEDCVQRLFGEEMYVILRFPGLFDYAGKARKSQPGLYYFVDAVRNEIPIYLVSNYERCARNFLPIEIASEMIGLSLNSDIVGVFNAHIDSFTFSLKELLMKIVGFNSSYKPENIRIGEKHGLEYYIGSQSESLVSQLDIKEFDHYLKALYNSPEK